MASIDEAGNSSSEEDIETNGYETDFSSVGDISEFKPFPPAVNHPFERLVCFLALMFDVLPLIRRIYSYGLVLQTQNFDSSGLA